MPDTQSEAALAQMSGEGENGVAVQSAGVAIDDTTFRMQISALLSKI